MRIQLNSITEALCLKCNTTSGKEDPALTDFMLTCLTEKCGQFISTYIAFTGCHKASDKVYRILNHRKFR